MKGILHHTWGKLIAVALSLSLIAAAGALVFTGTPDPLREVGETLSRPFLRLFSAAAGAVDRAGEYMQGMERLRAENAALTEEVAQLKGQARAGDLAQAENDRLRDLLGLAQTGQDLTLTSAWVIARTPDNWQGEVVIDQGENQGVAAGQCVIDSHGALVGRVREAGATWSAVSLVTDPAFQVAGQGARSGVLGTLAGSLDLLPQGQTALTGLTQSDHIQTGEDIVTFAAGDTYPSGLVVGTVAEVTEDPGGLTRSAILDPAADLDSLGQVFVVTAFREVR